VAVKGSELYDVDARIYGVTHIKLQAVTARSEVAASTLLPGTPRLHYIAALAGIADVRAAISGPL